ncbi:MAG TPA: MFS transporter [Rhodopila sp.]|uniref:MFS transporter n=1 Tax=Rhodopila sp. TaxID=2480087 RepID=UPI002CBC6908|nr:MFS transporter [Rhodopila sp.]HVY17755.1 MFS transporter [Rhodopila sp.]
MDDTTTSIPEVRPPGVSPMRAFWAAWAGWMLDGFDTNIYAFVLVPALTELLRNDGMVVDKAHIAQFGGFLFSIFMVGWACSMFWGWLADRIGRVKVMCLTILLYSFATALCGAAWSLSSFAVFRLLAGFGIGGEWAAGTPMLQESVPERLRVRYGGLLHTATPTGGFLAVCASFLVPYIGWRGVFYLGVAPSLLTIWLRRDVPEPEAWRQRKVASAIGGIAPLFRGEQARTTWAAAGMLACIIFGLWSCTFWAPTLVVTKLTARGVPFAQAQHTASVSGLLLNGGTMVACGLMPWIATGIGPRRRAAFIFFMGSMISVFAAYIIAAEVLDSVTLFLWLQAPMGFFTVGVFALFTLWLPELFPTAQRSFGAGFAFSLGRLLGAVGPTVVGAVVAVTGSFPVAITAVSVIYLLGLPAIAAAPETAGKPLPA